jgi:hypothetical protein
MLMAKLSDLIDRVSATVIRHWTASDVDWVPIARFVSDAVSRNLRKDSVICSFPVRIASCTELGCLPACFLDATRNLAQRANTTCTVP